ncbi:MAG: TetR/AcrR family transcriptional regulator [Pseudomonadota bacterium]
MARPKLTDEERHRARRVIVEAAQALYAKGGIDALKTGAIAEAAGVGRTTIYSYFATADEIVAAILWDITDELEAILVQVAKAESEPDVRLRAVLNAYVTFARENWEEFRILFMNTDPKPGELVMIGPEPQKRPGYVATRDAVIDGMKKGIFVEGDPDLAAQAAWAATWGAIGAPKGIAGFAWYDGEELEQQVIDVVIDGLRTIG